MDNFTRYITSILYTGTPASCGRDGKLTLHDPVDFEVKEEEEGDELRHSKVSGHKW